MTIFNPIKILWGFLALVAAVQITLLFTLEINWDEFLNLSMVYDHRRGQLEEILQTAFIHLFGWVSTVSVNEVNQIVAARGLIFLFALATSFAIWASAKALSDDLGALLALLSYWCFSYVMQHGIALRTDVLAAAPLMIALYCALVRAHRAPVMIFAGAMIGFGGALTIKAIFLVPAFCLILCIQLYAHYSVWRIIGQLLWAGLAAIATFAIILALHAGTFPEMADSVAFLQRTMGVTLWPDNRLVFLKYAFAALGRNLAFFIVLAMTITTILRGLIQREHEKPLLIAASLLTPLLVPLVYRDFYPYIYVLILPPVVVAMTVGWQTIRRFPSREKTVLAILFFTVWGINAVYSLLQSNLHQRQVLNVIHNTFPPDSAYIDARSMVASFRKSGIFMSNWGMADYLGAGKPVFHDSLTEDKPVFLLRNSDYFSVLDTHDTEKNRGGYNLLPTDAQVLRDHYVPFWGPVWIAGMDVSPTQSSIRIFVKGTYINQGPGLFALEGQTISAGQTIYLDEGVYNVATVTDLRLSLHYPVPQQAPPKREMFTGFLFSPF